MSMMSQPLILAPRYRLDDEMNWLEGIDPSRRYWLAVNGDRQSKVVIPAILRFRGLQPQEKMLIQRAFGQLIIHCVSVNCYAIEARVEGALAWHLFDKETIESFLLTSHPDWVPSPRDVELGRKLLKLSFEQPAYAV